MQTAGGRALTPAQGTLLRVRRSSKLTLAAIAVTVACFVALAIDLAGPGLQGRITKALAVAAAPLAFALAVRSAVAIWRGPPLAPFPIDYAVLRHGAEAEAIRAAAQLRGALGGAGHAHPARLVLALAAWALAGTAALCVAAGAVSGQGCTDLMVLLGVAVAVRIAFPPRPFWYRERQDGSVVLYPPSVAPHVCARRTA